MTSRSTPSDQVPIREATAGAGNLTVGAMQMSSVLGDVDRNLARAMTTLQLAATQGITALVLPECALTGYMFETLQAARDSALLLDGPEITLIRGVCRRLDISCVVGFVERTDSEIFNAAVLITPDGLAGHYRKAHLPGLGVDRFASPGDMERLPVVSTSWGRIGMAICYDVRFPEHCRVLALQGAEIVVMPTCWPQASTILPDHFLRVRAAENRVFIVAADRGDEEGGVTFLGRSQIVDPSGVVLAEAGRGESLLMASIDPRLARAKRLTLEPGAFELGLFDDRRPDLYKPLTSGSPKH
jgi:predicted amidohydrolase